jgi:NADH:ubiquinone oxidoreductase subunit 6 (subunit J)
MTTLQHFLHKTYPNESSAGMTFCGQSHANSLVVACTFAIDHIHESHPVHSLHQLKCILYSYLCSAALLGAPAVAHTCAAPAAGTLGMSFSFSSACTQENMHSKPVENIQEAVDVAIEWLTSPSFAWTAAT